MESQYMLITYIKHLEQQLEPCENKHTTYLTLRPISSSHVGILDLRTFREAFRSTPEHLFFLWNLEKSLEPNLSKVGYMIIIFTHTHM